MRLLKRFAPIILAILCTSPAFALNITLTWTQTVSSPVSANSVYRSTIKGGPYDLIYSSTTPFVTYVDTEVREGSTYCYVVTATVNEIESGYSNEACATITVIAPKNVKSKIARN
jgi:hypothetical protein